MNHDWTITLRSGLSVMVTSQYPTGSPLTATRGVQPRGLQQEEIRGDKLFEDLLVGADRQRSVASDLEGRAVSYDRSFRP